MSKISCNNFFIAGCGGILRRKYPETAKDIDLAIVGLKDCFDQNKFYDLVSQYFRSLVDSYRHYYQSITNFGGYNFLKSFLKLYLNTSGNRINPYSNNYCQS